MEFTDINIPNNAMLVLNMLEDAEYEAFLCGGSIRDSLLGNEPKDWDLTTSASPEQMLEVFKEVHVVATGLKHNTISVVLTGYNPVEVTSYRVGGEYVDDRRPVSTEVPSAEEDIKRRDFTINALLFNPTSGGVDLVKGIKDLKSKTIRAVGDPDERFREDKLRMLRAVRFSAQLGFTIEKGTFQAICRNAGSITEVSAERIRDEFMKILLLDNPIFGLNLLEAVGLTRYILPELHNCVNFSQHNAHHKYDVFGHLTHTAANVPSDPVLRLAAIFHDIGKPNTFTLDAEGVGHFYGHDVASTNMADVILKRLKVDNDTISKVSILIRHHMSRFPKVREVTVKRLMERVGIYNLDNLMALQRADILASAPPYDFAQLDTLAKEVSRIIEVGEPFRVKDLAITGDDLIALGVPEGPEIGVILKATLDAVAENPELNIRERLLAGVEMFL